MNKSNDMNISHDNLKIYLQEIVGMVVQKVGVGGSTGSVFSLLFSNSVEPRKELYIMVKCAWRLDYVSKKLPLTSWQESSSLNGPMTTRMQELSNDIVKEVVLLDFFDVQILFKSGKRLFVFCDVTPNVDGDTNWFLGNVTGYYSINQYLKCVFEKRDK